MKQHIKYGKYYSHFGNERAILSFPKFNINILDSNHFFFSRFLGISTNTLLWDSRDFTIPYEKLLYNHKKIAYSLNPSRAALLNQQTLIFVTSFDSKLWNKLTIS